VHHKPASIAFCQAIIPFLRKRNCRRFVSIWEETMHATPSADSETQEHRSQLRKKILKLRWMGMAREADELARALPSSDGLSGAPPPLVADRD
jgi:hypothetical protein